MIPLSELNSTTRLIARILNLFRPPYTPAQTLAAARRLYETLRAGEMIAHTVPRPEFETEITAVLTGLGPRPWTETDHGLGPVYKKLLDRGWLSQPVK